MKALRHLCLTLLVSLPLGVTAQSAGPGKPADFLDKEFHRQRREALRQKLPAHSVAVLFSNPLRNRANDVDFHFHQHPDFYYLTGYREPNAVLLLFSEQQVINGVATQEVLFAQPRNPQRESWTGKRLGEEGVKQHLGLTHALPATAFANLKLDTAAFDQILFLELPHDLRNDPGDKADLYDLVAQFRQKIGLKPGQDFAHQELYQIIRMYGGQAGDRVQQEVRRQMAANPDLGSNVFLKSYAEAKDASARAALVANMPAEKFDLSALEKILAELRETKLPEEMKLLRKAIAMSAIGQVEVMKAMHPNMSETEVQGIHEFVYKKYGAEYEGYPSIVGAGNNGCILHYIDNEKPRLGNELVLMDLGAEYHGYTADVTRTIPANGKFTPEQKQIYELVYAAQEAGFKECKVGNAFNAPNTAAQKLMADGLVKLGIIKSPEEARRYTMHGVSHYLGLDVHDRGTYGPFKPNTVITVEPGIYIPEGSPCDKKWWGIGVRIEDDVLITENGWENLSAAAPRTIKDIEATMAKPSPLDNFKLPELR
ncbi:aminopeptidase P N-terminal domain-containing protein [Rufibacter sp. XAAS-G3-1]|uniref:aminopeptidase P N-terminal domain-containing protein n=1 Tax=Rufibacter sp. XAAS-G3-1 TaxID=2729134 RepID=UPI0015E65BAE|nr:aminopeptidase P N-terminal domain-containing protein [Rufibacter sp. XAAS-G3-1]